MKNRGKVGFGIIGLGLMGKEFSSSVARWCSLLSEGPVPVIKGICDTNREAWNWYTGNFPDIRIKTENYRELLDSDEIDAIYCAVPHNLHEHFYIDIINAGKHLLGEKPFGIDKKANENILKAVKANPAVVVRCSSEFPYFPACQQLIKWLRAGKYGRIIEVRTGFHHSSDLDLTKPINWKRMIENQWRIWLYGRSGYAYLAYSFSHGMEANQCICRPSENCKNTSGWKRRNSSV